MIVCGIGYFLELHIVIVNLSFSFSNSEVKPVLCETG